MLMILFFFFYLHPIAPVGFLVGPADLLQLIADAGDVSRHMLPPVLMLDALF